MKEQKKLKFLFFGIDRIARSKLTKPYRITLIAKFKIYYNILVLM
jgi:hypothetical protein